MDAMVLVIDEDDLLADLRVGEADAAGIAQLGMAIRRTAPRIWRASSDSEKRSANSADGRPVMRKLMIASPLDG
jgi:hypothetical protein